MQQKEPSTDPRAVAYEILSHLFRQGLIAPLRPYAALFPDLAEPANRLQDDDAAAVEHQRVLGFEVFPFEGVFLSDEARVGAFDGGSLDEVLEPYSTVRALYRAAPEGADHIASQLAFLGGLCQEMADNEPMAEVLPAVTRHFLDHHLLRWLPALSFAMARQDSNLYMGLARATLRLVLDHRAELFPPLLSPHPRIWAAWPEVELEKGDWQPAPDWLEQPETGLRDIADFLLTPARSGLFLSRGEIRRLGRPDALPTGFGERRTMLLNVLGEAAAYGSISGVLERLLAIVQEAGAFHAKMPSAIEWLERLSQTKAILLRMQQVARDGAPGSPKERAPKP